MVKLTLPLLDNLDNEPITSNSKLPNCDPSQSIYDSRYCVKDFLFCSDDNPCPSKIPCVDRVCQCLPNAQNPYISLTPQPVRMYTVGCNFDTKRDFDGGCRDYEYATADKSCVLNYCSSEVRCLAGTCDMGRHVCTNVTSNRKPLPPPTSNEIITLGDDPFGTHKEGFNPVLIILIAAGSVMALAVVGCVVRTTTNWTKRTFKWAAGGRGQNGDEEHGGNGEEKEDSMTNKDNMSFKRGDDEGTDSVMSEDSHNAMTRKPSKFTGNHFMPSPQLGPSGGGQQLHPSASGGRGPMFQNPNDSNISDFSSPLPSPRFSPYSQPNNNQSHVSNSSLLNPFRQGRNVINENNGAGVGGQTADSNDMGMVMEMNTRSVSPFVGSVESLQLQGLQGSTAASTPTPSEEIQHASAGAGAGAGVPDLRVSRSHSALSRNSASLLGPGGPGSGATGPGDRISVNGHLHKSVSMQQLGARPAPPPPASGLSRTLSANRPPPPPPSSSSQNNNTTQSYPPPPMIAVSLPQPSTSPLSSFSSTGSGGAGVPAGRSSEAIMQGPALSLNSLIHQQHVMETTAGSGADSPIALRSQPLPLPSYRMAGAGAGVGAGAGAGATEVGGKQEYVPPQLTKSRSVGSSLVIQSGAERVPSLIVSEPHHFPPQAATTALAVAVEEVPL